MADTSPKPYEILKYLAPLWIFLPGLAVAISLVMHNATMDDIRRYALLTTATTSFSYCVGTCMTRSVRMVEFAALIDWCRRIELTDGEEWNRCLALIEQERRCRNVYLATTVCTGMAWYATVQNHCEQVTGDPGNSLVAAFSACLASGLAVWKVFENTKSKPVGVQFSGIEVEKWRTLVPPVASRTNEVSRIPANKLELQNTQEDSAL